MTEIALAIFRKYSICFKEKLHNTVGVAAKTSVAIFITAKILS